MFMNYLYRFLKKKYLKLTEEKWVLGISFPQRGELGLDKINWIKNPYKDRWFADPFILEETRSTISLFVEEWEYSVKKGNISQIVVDKKTLRIVERTTILNLPTHLSFPVIFRRAGEVFFYPENSEAGELAIYSYEPKTKRVTKQKVLLREKIADAIIFERKGIWFLVGTQEPNVNGDTLAVFSAPQFDGDYVYRYNVKFKDASARGAGDVFFDGSNQVRVTQDCTRGYGKGLVFSTLVDDDERLLFEEYFRFYLPGNRALGIHTYNRTDESVIVDKKVFRYPIIGHVIAFLGRLFLK